MAEPAISLQSVLSKAGKVRKSGDNWTAKCPAHEDHRDSLSIGQGANGHILLHCHAGCSFEAILAAWNLQAKELLPPKDSLPPRKPKGLASVVYDYRDRDGKLIYQVVRMEPKDFRQRRIDPASGRFAWDMKGVTKVPYRLNEVVGNETIYVVEGEKDADTLWRVKLPATTNSGGAGKWDDSYSHALKDAGVVRAVLLPDNDAAGLRHMEHVAASLKSVDIAVNLIQLEGLMLKGDVSDWLMHHDVSELELLVARRPWVLPRFAAIGLEPPPPLDPLLDPTRFPMTDLGNAEAFVEKEGHNLRWDVSQERWLLWNGIIWQPDRDLSIHRVANAHVRQRQVDAVEYIRDKQSRDTWSDYLFKLERKSGLDTITEMTKRLLPVADNGRGWDEHPWNIACLNGVIDLRTGELRDGERSEKMTMHTPLLFNPEAPCDRWLQFLSEIFDGDADLVSYTQRALGYSLTGDMREQCFFMCVGSGSNGKSTFLSTLNHVWGEYSYTTDMRTFATNAAGQDTSSFDLAELAQRRMILASETKTNSRLNEHALKNFTGGEKINAARKYGHPFEYTPTGKIWIGVNHQPRVTDDSFGFWRRVRIVPFLRSFSGSSNDPILKDKLRSEAPGILAWAIRGCLDWLRDGLNPPASVTSATDAYKDTEDPIIDFLTERTIPDAEGVIPCAKLYKGYLDWCNDQGFSEKERLSSNSFGRNMTRRYDRKSNGVTKCYSGLRLTVKMRDEFDFSV